MLKENQLELVISIELVLPVEEMQMQESKVLQVHHQLQEQLQRDCALKFVVYKKIPDTVAVIR